MIKLFGIRHCSRRGFKPRQFQQNAALGERISKLERNFERFEKERKVEERIHTVANVTMASVLLGVYYYFRR